MFVTAGEGNNAQNKLLHSQRKEGNIFLRWISCQSSSELIPLLFIACHMSICLLLTSHLLWKFLPAVQHPVFKVIIQSLGWGFSSALFGKVHWNMTSPRLLILISTLAFNLSHSHLSLFSGFLQGKVTLVLDKLHFCKSKRINIVCGETVWLWHNFLCSHGCIYFSGVSVDGICWVPWAAVAVSMGSLQSILLFPFAILALQLGFYLTGFLRLLYGCVRVKCGLCSLSLSGSPLPYHFASSQGKTFLYEIEKHVLLSWFCVL